MKFAKIAATTLIIALGASAAIAQTATTPTAPTAPVAPKAAVTPSTTPPAAPAVVPPKAAATNPAMKTATTPEGKACSAEADTKNLHGKERVKFRKACIKGMMAKKS